jgi:hypothetical protein
MYKASSVSVFTLIVTCTLGLLFAIQPRTGYCLEGGYASLTSVAQGESIDLHISTRTAEYSLEVYREGNPRMLMQRVRGLQGAEYDCPEPGYATGCGWPVAYTLDVPAEWPSGVYMVEFNTGSDGSGTSLIIFVVREDNPGSTSPIFFALASNTHNAYNPVGGKSLYDYNSSDGIPSPEVSYDRPYPSPGDGSYYRREHPFVLWAESLGYPIEYGTSVDLHRDPDLLSNYSLFVCTGHDEYWSLEMRDHLDAFVDAGGNAAILSGNTCWWQVRFSPDLRTVICYKYTALTDDPVAIDGDPSNDILVTTNWYKPPVNYPENTTTGLSWRHGGYHDHGSSFLAQDGYGGYRVYRTDHWVFDGTGLADGETIGQAATIVGYEVDGTLLEARDAEGNPAWDADGYYPLPGALPYVVNTASTGTPENFIVLGLAPATKGHGIVGIFQRGDGGEVFNSGTIDWIQGLATDASVSRITSNVIDRFTGLDPASNSAPQAVIDAISSRAASEGDEISFEGSGTDADGTISLYRWRSSLDGYLSDQATFSTSLLSVGAHTIHFAVQDDSGAWSSEVDAIVQVMPPGQEAFVLDDGQPGTSSTGDWRESGGADPYGTRSLYSKTTGGTYTFEVGLPSPGEYDIELWWTEWDSRLTAVPVHIAHAGGTSTITINQQEDGGQWNPVGSWTFNGSATITIESLGGGSTCADAVRVIPGGTTENLPPVATIDSITPSPSQEGNEVTFVGHGEDTDGSVTAYEWRSSIDGVLSDQPEFTTTELSPGLHSISLRVQDDVGAWSTEARTVLDVIAAPGSGLILDNGETGTSSTGSWDTSGGLEPYGTNSLYSRQVGATYSYNLSLPASGAYEVHLWWTEYPSRLSSVPVTIAHAAGTEEFRIDQQTGGGQWNLLGTWSFASMATITIHSEGGGSTCADAVKLVPVGPSENDPPVATIDSIAPNPAQVDDEVTFSGSGADPDGSVVAYLWRSSLDGDLSTEPTFSTTALSAGAHTISFLVQDNAGAWSAEAQEVLVVEGPGAGEEVIVDNGDPGTSSTGYWANSAGLEPYGESSLYSRELGAAYTFEVALPAPGQYEVQLWWTEYSSRLSNVPVTITHGAQTDTVIISQQAGGGQWNPVGTWDFTSTATITVYSQGGGSTCADAVRLVPAPETP